MGHDLTFFEQWANEETLRRHFAVPETRKFARLLRELAVPAANIPVRMPDRVDVYDATKARV